MTFIVNARPYRGRFHLKAVALVKSGVRVGQVIVSEESPTWQCHICKANNSKPGFEAGMSDAW